MMRYSSFNKRLMAATIDSGIALFTLAPLVDWLLRATILSHQSAGLIDLEQLQQYLQETDVEARIMLLKSMMGSWLIGTCVQAMVLVAVSMICWKYWSATPGKMLLRMKIVDTQTGQPISNRQIIRRGLGYIPACTIIFLGIFWIAIDKRKQGWHDKIADTVVIDVPRAK